MKVVSAGKLIIESGVLTVQDCAGGEDEVLCTVGRGNCEVLQVYDNEAQLVGILIRPKPLAL